MEITLHYLFSAIAQSAAAFVGFIAVFAIFRFQTATNEVEERYREAKNWLTSSTGGPEVETNIKVSSMAKKTVKEELNKQIEQNQVYFAEKAKDALDNIDRSEKYLEELVKYALKPIKEWIWIFLGSLIALFLFSNIKIWGILIAIVSLGYIIKVSLKDTVEFMKHCLSVKN